MVEGLKTAQLTPVMTGPKFVSPEEGMVSDLSDMTTGDWTLKQVEESFLDYL